MPECTTADGVRIAYDDTGSGPAIVFVHGITDNRALWAPIIHALARDHRCLALDLRGHGESADAADYSALSMAQDVAAVVAAAGLPGPPHLVGHSLGAVVVTVAAAMGGAASVVNVDQSLRFSDFAGALQPLAPLLRGPAFHETLAMMFQTMEGEHMPPPLAESLRAKLAGARQDVVLGVWELVLSTPPAELDGITAQLGPAITMPYLALHGLPLAPGYEDWLLDLVPQAVVEEWPGDGHYLHLVERERFIDRVREHVARA